MALSSLKFPSTIGFLGFGEAARSFASSLGTAGHVDRFAAWDIALSNPDRSTAMHEAMALHNVAILAGPEELKQCDWIFSAVTASQCLNAGTTVASFIRPNQIFIDINSVAPAVKRQVSDIVSACGAKYVDMAVMAPVHPRGHVTPICVASSIVDEIWPLLQSLGFNGDIVGTAPGAATAIKMVRSLFVKGLEAITVEALLAAEASGCLDTILASLSASYPGLGWPTIANYHFERLTRHGKRRSEEMMMSAETLDALGLNGQLAREIAFVHAGTYAANGATDAALHATVAEALNRRLKAVQR